MTQNLYGNCHQIALLMSVSTIIYYYDNIIYRVESKLREIVWSGQLMEGVIR